MITGEQVKAAVMAAGITYIPHHDCGCCGEWVAYEIYEGSLYFNASCGCSGSQAQPCSWDDAADWINMQSNDDVKNELMAEFGITPNKRIDMKDKELLELAAKAAANAGMPIIQTDAGPQILERKSSDSETYGKWNPLENDGDRYRLAKKLNFDINFSECFASYFCEQTNRDKVIVWSGEGNPVNDAYAIVHAAAEIGKSK